MTKRKHLISMIIFLLFFITNNSTAQGTIQDPLEKFDMFFENSFAFNATRVNTSNTEFSTSNGDFTFKKNNYLPTFDFNVNFGWLLNKDSSHDINSIKTGINFTTRSANLADESGNDLRLTSSYLMIPVQYNIRRPIKFNTVKNNLFRAIEFGAGVYVSSPFYQKLDHPDNIDAAGATTWFNYLRYGIIGEIAFTALNDEGHGHKFGLRFSSDFASITKFNETKNELYPYYVNIGVFYNITNDYFKKK